MTLSTLTVGLWGLMMAVLKSVRLSKQLWIKEVGVLTISRIDSKPPLKRAGRPNKLAAYLFPALVHSLHSMSRGPHRHELLPDAGRDNL